MNDAVRVTHAGLLTTAELAARADFTLGLAAISPSTRTVAGPGGTVDVEPRVMQVLVVLADAAGQVVTRETLFQRCWGGVYVGDDSLNRAIGAVRKLASDIGGGSFEIETIPRTGYRLTGETPYPQPANVDAPAQPQRGIPRRVMIGSITAAGLAAAVGAGLWSARSREDREFSQFVDQGRQALNYGHPSYDPVPYLTRAVAMRPDDAEAQGLLAFAQAAGAEHGDSGQAAASVAAAERAARAALRVDPHQPNARLALVLLHQAMLDMATTEDSLRQVLATDPNNIYAMRPLWGLLQSAGRSRDAFAMIERAIALEPLAAANNYPRAQLLWILGRTAEADRVIDSAMQYWPMHPWVRAARFTIFAYTGRPRAALAMLDDDKLRPQEFTASAIALWRSSLRALDDPSTSNIALARSANFDAGRADPRLAFQAVLVLSALGQIDPAFDIANDLLLFRRPVAATVAGQPPVKSTAWRFTPWLFTPPAAPMRADLRFKALCDGIGLTDYWAGRRIRPDYQVAGA